jgi:predicted metal-dependent peptidase
MNDVALTIKRILLNEPFYGLFLCGVSREFNNRTKTASVSLQGIDYKLNINKEYWDKLTPEYRYGTLKHEILHLCFGHLTSWKQIVATAQGSKQVANIAADLEVESYINESLWERENGELTCVADIFFNSFPHLLKRAGTKYYIEFLNQFQSAVTQEDGDGQQSDQSEEPTSQPFKDDGLNEDYNHLSNEEKQQLKRDLQTPLHDLWDAIGNLSPEEQRLIKNQLDHLMKQAAQAAGTGSWPNELKQYLTELITPKPPIFNWKAHFRRLLGVNFDVNLKKTKRKESLRFQDADGLKKKKKHQLLVAIDTSGSVGDKEYKDFFSEILNIYKAGASVHILECDTEITASYDFNGKMPDKRSSEGGTSFAEPIKFYNAHKGDYNMLIYLTDGYGDTHECLPLGKMTWIITPNGAQDNNYPGYKICIPKDY